MRAGGGGDDGRRTWLAVACRGSKEVHGVGAGARMPAESGTATVTVRRLGDSNICVLVQCGGVDGD
jgi:hypothetical protein